MDIKGSVHAFFCHGVCTFREDWSALLANSSGAKTNTHPRDPDGTGSVAYYDSTF